ncbi:hypothetical protein [Hoeflea sp. TYP-13]|uniref:hypothetical protein n=1 Tax=Hoeflea sp. TYP-13 TaxID=3230023 RepID=UPI0034C642AA
MYYRTIGVVALLLFAIGFTVNAAAGDYMGCYRNDIASKSDKAIELASLGSERSKPLQMSPRIYGALPAELGMQATEPGGVLVAGRCGSSNYYCNEAGFTYCCGTSSAGYYCAADVNGCTR